MPDPADSRGRRANGLPATDWGALVDLDPRLSEGLLDRLAAAGVAAYVEPATAVDTVHRAVTMPARPMDRLWVDPSRADSAREVVASEVADLTALLAEDDPGATAFGLVHPVPRYAARRVLAPPALPGAGAPVPDPPGAGSPGAGSGGAGPPPDAPPALPPMPPMPPKPAMPPTDDDVFAELVARFHSPAAGTATWPAAEDLPAQDPRPAADPAGAGGPARPAGPAAPAGPPSAAPPHRRRTDSSEPAQPRDWVPPETAEDDGHFVPPPPPPVPRIRLRTFAAVLAVVLGMIGLFVPQLVGLGATYGVGVLGLVLLAGGAAALVWSMRDAPGSGPDDGAIV